MNQLTLHTDSITVTITAAEYELVRSELEYLEEDFQMFTTGGHNPKLTFHISTRKSFEKAFANDATAKPRFLRIIEKLQLVKWADETEATETKKAPFTHLETGEQGIIGLDGMFYPIETVEAVEAEMKTKSEPAKVTVIGFNRPTVDREKKEVVERVTRTLNKVIDRIERGVGYKSAIEMENYVSAWLGLISQFGRFDAIINRHADNSHDIVLESALPELRALLAEITVENVVL